MKPNFKPAGALEELDNTEEIEAIEGEPNLD
ncbi:hypothetical protein LCGC14_1117920 [marine sediment metagenome]|uniref:Uncharacterized protein n=1 Tax=marine sediment metagenome TaxID=412755 RepID=A0A0F9M4T1_9ZZZZ